jgi:hypothetical protein
LSPSEQRSKRRQKVSNSELRKSGQELIFQIEKLIGFLKLGLPRPTLKKAAQGLETSRREFSALYKVRREAELGKLDALDRALVEKGGFSIHALKKMSVSEKAIELSKISNARAAAEDE